MNIKKQIMGSVLLLAISVGVIGCCHAERTRVTTTRTEAQPVTTTSTTTTPI